MKVTVVGDSVAWGQGLLDTHKYSSIVNLQAATQRFTSPESRFVVTGYYPILSRESAPFRVPLLLATQGVSFAPFMHQETVFDKVVALGLQFWHESTDCLQSAVRDCGDARVSFADAAFTESNAVFATTPLLWGVKTDFSPQDEVVGDRHAACDVAYPLPLTVVEREACYRASAGHPNVAGAEQFAQAIVASLAVV